MYICLIPMKRSDRHISLSGLVLITILLCSIVCSVANALGNSGWSQELSVTRKDLASTPLTAPLAEKAESESDTKTHSPLFVIQTIEQDFSFDLRLPCRPGPLYATRFGAFVSAVPRYLAERTLRI